MGKNRIGMEYSMESHGCFILPEFVPYYMVVKMIGALERCYEKCRELQIVADLPNTEGTCHHLIGQDSIFMECLTLYEDLDEYFKSYFGGKYILNSFGGNLLTKDSSYASEIHRDIRSFSGDLPLMLNTLVTLDEFTPENGATWLMSGSHKYEFKPTPESFNYDAFQIIGKPGTIAMWNSNLWHRAGVNTTDKPRRSITPIFSRPFFKPGFDYPRCLGYDNSRSYSPWLRGVLGYDARIPATLEEWYRKDRFYKGD